MGYAHIDNLYKNQLILMFRECYALEKIHGTSAHVSIGVARDAQDALVLEADGTPKVEVGFYAGGASHDAFVKLFDVESLKSRFLALGMMTKIIVHGEAYGGKMQGMSKTYGKDLKFVAFDVKVGEHWLDVPNAEDVTVKLGLEFVPYNKVSTDTEVLNAQRDLPSRQAVRNGILEPQIAEGVVLRPPIEVMTKSGARICAKHKRPEFSERASGRDTVVDPAKAEILVQAEAIAAEWVTDMRLTHVTDKLSAALGRPLELGDTGTVIKAMVEDVMREGAGEIQPSKEAERAIGKAASGMFRKRLTSL